MKEYKIKLAVSLIVISGMLTAAGCNSIVQESTDSVSGTYSAVEDVISSDTVTESDTDTSMNSENSDTSETDTAHNSDKETSSKDETDSDKGNKENKDVSSKAASSANVSSRNVSSKAPSKVAGIELDVRDITLWVDQTGMPIVTMTPADAANKDEIWKSSDEKVATVDKNGTIRGISDGKCVVTVTSVDNPSVKAQVKVTVKKRPTVRDISVSSNSFVLKVGETVMPEVTMTPQDADTLEESWTSSNDAVATVDRYGNITGHSVGTCKITVTSVSNKSVSKDITVTVTDEDSEEGGSSYETGSQGESYFDGILVVNKSYGLPSDYNPGGLTSECSQHFETLRKAAADDGIYIYIASGFRSYETQRQLYNDYVNIYGQAEADTFSARPGYSEHQTGLAIDCNTVNENFIGTAEANWLDQHAHEYGFIIRYPQGKQEITGYKYEPWHIRYVGEEFAQKLHDSGLTIEEYFGIDSSY